MLFLHEGDSRRTGTLSGKKKEVYVCMKILKKCTGAKLTSFQVDWFKSDHDLLFKSQNHEIGLVKIRKKLIFTWNFLAKVCCWPSSQWQEVWRGRYWSFNPACVEVLDCQGQDELCPWWPGGGRCHQDWGCWWGPCVLLQWLGCKLIQGWRTNKDFDFIWFKDDWKLFCDLIAFIFYKIKQKYD